MNEPLPTLLRRASSTQRKGHAVALCLIVAARGSTPQAAGALMFLDDSGHLFGTVGGGCLEAEVRRRAMTLLCEQQSALFRFRLDHDYGWDDGLICGGAVEVAVAPAPPADDLDEIASAIERGLSACIGIDVQTDDARERFTLNIPPRPRLAIAGAGHIGCAVARHAVALEFDVTIFDDRPDILDRAPRGARTVCGPIAGALAQAAIDDNTYCLIVTRGHRHDQQALAAILAHIDTHNIQPRYIGMIGSRRKIKVIFDDLHFRGAPRDQLAAIHAPVGLPLGAQTVEEIAISIAAQLVQVRAAAGAASQTVERRILSPRADTPGPRRPIGLLLAAGRGCRMACTKQLLPVPYDSQHRQLAAAAFDAIAGRCSHMIVVVAHEAEAVLASLQNRAFTHVYAPSGTEMSESLRVGLHAALAVDAAAPILLHLADHIRVKPRTLSALLRAGSANPFLAVLPTCEGRGGHPILIPASLAKALLRQPLDGGLRAWWDAHPESCLHLPLEDPSILLDLDTPEQYERLMAEPLQLPPKITPDPRGTPPPQQPDLAPQSGITPPSLSPDP